MESDQEQKPNRTPAERFSLVMRGLVAVSKEELADALKNNPAPPLKPGRKPKQPPQEPNR